MQEAVVAIRDACMPPPQGLSMWVRMQHGHNAVEMPVPLCEGRCGPLIEALGAERMHVYLCHAPQSATLVVSREPLPVTATLADVGHRTLDTKLGRRLVVPPDAPEFRVDVSWLRGPQTNIFVPERGGLCVEFDPASMPLAVAPPVEPPASTGGEPPQAAEPDTLVVEPTGEEQWGMLDLCVVC
jgi:hypothetical protein